MNPLTAWAIVLGLAGCFCSVICMSAVIVGARSDKR